MHRDSHARSGQEPGQVNGDSHARSGLPSLLSSPNRTGSGTLHVALSARLPVTEVSQSSAAWTDPAHTNKAGPGLSQSPVRAARAMG